MKRLMMGFLLLPSALGAAALTPEQILSKSDAIRIPMVDYTLSVKLISHRPEKEPDVSTYKAYVKGRDRSIVKTLTPKVNRGQLLLMNADNFWAYLPNVSKPLRISLQERLAGEVANGDLARANFSGDYTATFSTSVKEESSYVLDLKAKKDSVTYGRVVLWVHKSNYRPKKAEFYAFSGRLLKTATYGNYMDIGGGSRPTKLTLRDAVKTDYYSIVEYQEMLLGPIPDKYFTKDYLKKLTDE